MEEEKTCDEVAENSGNNWWWIIVFAGIIILVIVIIVVFATKKSSQEKPRVCKSAEYPSVAENQSCDPNVVEISLTASDNEVQILTGNTTKLYNYNNSFPGPLIEANKGDLLIVHFFNDISEPTTVTWHGLAVDATMDGSEISQPPVKPGDSFTYKFKLNTAGLFWYHSDINPAEQVHKGLYGVILVKDYGEDENYCLPSTEKILAFSDIKLNNKNQVEMYCDDEDELERLTSYVSEEHALKSLQTQVNGVIGNLVLTNGVYQGCINIYRNEPTRLRMVNCAIDRFMKIFIEGHDMLRIGGDQGLIEKPILIKSEIGLLLTPGERADIVFVPRKDNIRMFTSANPRGVSKVVLDKCGNYKVSREVSHNRNNESRDEEKLLLVTFTTQDLRGEEGENYSVGKLEIPLELKKTKKIYVDHCTPVIPVKYSYGEGEGNFSAYKGIPFDSLTAKEAPIVVEDGTYIIEVTNTSPLANNFHLHGFSFQHLDTIYVNEKGEKDQIINPVVENKDTIYIPPSNFSKVVVRLAVDFSNKTGKCNRDIVAYGGRACSSETWERKEPRECRSGGWIFQSHILTNAQAGQQGFIQIIAECDRSKYSSYSGYSNTYSDYSTSSGGTSHSACLTRSSNSSNFSQNTQNKQVYSSELEKSLDYITQSLINCSCGSGLAATVCCNRNKNRDSRNRRNFSGGYSTDGSDRESSSYSTH